MTPTATVTGKGIVTMQMLNQYGCVIRGSAKLNILPPDMTVTVLGNGMLFKYRNTCQVQDLYE
jgi:hypothetical protein